MQSVLRRLANFLRPLFSRQAPAYIRRWALSFWFFLKRKMNRCSEWSLGRNAGEARQLTEKQSKALDKSSFVSDTSTVTICASAVPGITVRRPTADIEQGYPSAFVVDNAQDYGLPHIDEMTSTPPGSRSASASRSSLRLPSPSGPFGRSSPVSSRASSPARGSTGNLSNLGKSDQYRAPSPAHSFVSRKELIVAAPPSRDNATPFGKARRDCLKGMSDMGAKRYYKTTVVKQRKGSYTIGAMARSYERRGVPDGWQACTHPEGALYYYNEGRKILTEDNICDPKTLELIDDFACFIDRETGESQFESGASTPNPRGDEPTLELVLCLFQGEDEEDTPKCEYYMADNDTHLLLWLEPRDASSMIADFTGEVTESQVAIEMEARYCMLLRNCSLLRKRQHCEMFPCHREFSEDLYREMMGILVHSAIDALTSEASMSPYSEHEVQAMISVVKNTKDVGSHGGYAVCVLSRLMCTFLHARFVHRWGHHDARLYRTQSIFGVEYKRSWIIKIFGPVLFLAPLEHLHYLERKVWVDQVITLVSWVPYVAKLTEEWDKLVVMATVMLTVNVSFLAINSVDNSDPDVRSIPQIASYFSTIASIGSIMLGLLLVRYHRVITHARADTIEQILLSFSHPEWGLETLAVMYSLPYALLMWAMVTFLIALSCQCFQVVGSVPAESVQMRLPVAIAWAFVLGLLVWLLVTDFKSDTWSARNAWIALWRKVKLPSMSNLTHDWARRFKRSLVTSKVGNEDAEMSSISTAA